MLNSSVALAAKAAKSVGKLITKIHFIHTGRIQHGDSCPTSHSVPKRSISGLGAKGKRDLSMRLEFTRRAGHFRELDSTDFQHDTLGCFLSRLPLWRTRCMLTQPPPPNLP